MDRADLADWAEQLIDIYQSSLLIDSFIQVKVEIEEGDFTSKCIVDKSPLSWIVKLNPEKHNDIFDIQYSIIESLLTIMFDDLNYIKDEDSLFRVKRNIIARLTTSLCDILSEDNDQDIEEEIDEED